MSNLTQQVVPEGYKLTEVGVIPEDWSCIDSSEAINYFGGYGFSSRLASSSGIRWLKIANVGINEIKWSTESFLPSEMKESFAAYVLKFDDVVMALTRPILSNKLKIAKIGCFDHPALLNQRVARLDAKPSHEINFLYYVVQRLNFVANMNLSMAGTDPPNIGTVALGKIKIAVPSNRGEQTGIANALSGIDTLIISLEKLVAKKRAIKTAAMQQLLTGKKRLPPFDRSHTGYKQTELGEIPEDWEVCELSKFVGALEAGVSVNSVDDKAAFGHGKAILKTSCISGGYFYPDEAKGIVPKDLARAKLNPARGNIIISRMNTPDLVGEIGYVAEDHENLFLPDRLWQTKYRSNEGVCGRWLAFTLSYPDIAKQIKESATGTSNSMKNISKSSLLATLLPAPSFDEQEAIAGVLSDIDNGIDSLNKRLIKTQKLKQGMMQELLTGKTRLLAGEV